MSDNSIITLSKDELIQLIEETVKPIEDRLISLENNIMVNNTKIELCIHEIKYMKESYDIGLVCQKSPLINDPLAVLLFVIIVVNIIPMVMNIYWRSQ